MKFLNFIIWLWKLPAKVKIAIIVIGLLLAGFSYVRRLQNEVEKDQTVAVEAVSTENALDVRAAGQNADAAKEELIQVQDENQQIKDMSDEEIREALIKEARKQQK